MRFTIRNLLWLMMAVTVGSVAAQEPGQTLKELVRQASSGPNSTSEISDAVRWQMSYHADPQWGGRKHILVVSWFHWKVVGVLRYKVTENGESDNVRCYYNHASQDYRDETLSTESMRSLRDLLLKLPASSAEPPIERTVHVSFQAGDKWRTETYDAAKLPDEFEKVMLIIGERFETEGRHGKKAK
jgi:hypothetical protein